MSKRSAFDEKLCTSCNLCSMYCSLVFTKSEYKPSVARIRVSENAEDTKYAAHVCLQCSEPACADACPVGAISTDPITGIVNVDQEACSSCGACIDACEYDCIFMVGDKAVKCEVCDEPLCVRACAVRALSPADSDDGVKEQGELYKEVRL